MTVIFTIFSRSSTSLARGADLAAWRWALVHWRTASWSLPSRRKVLLTFRWGLWFVSITYRLAEETKGGGGTLVATSSSSSSKLVHGDGALVGVDCFDGELVSNPQLLWCKRKSGKSSGGSTRQLCQDFWLWFVFRQLSTFNQCRVYNCRVLSNSLR